MNRFPIVAFSLIALLLPLTGCVEVDMGLKVNSDGRGTYSMILDFSKLAAISSGDAGDSTVPQNSGAFDEYAVGKICETLTRGAPQPQNAPIFDLKKAQCEALGDYKAKLTIPNVDLVAQKLLKIGETPFSRSYVLTFEDPSQESLLGDSSSKEQTSQLKALGASILLTIEMPGEIKSSSVGKVSGDKKKVSIDLLEDYGQIKTGIVVVSEEANYVFIGGALVAVIALVGAAWFLFLSKKPGKPV